MTFPAFVAVPVGGGAQPVASPDSRDSIVHQGDPLLSAATFDSLLEHYQIAQDVYWDNEAFGPKNDFLLALSELRATKPKIWTALVADVNHNWELKEDIVLAPPGYREISECFMRYAKAWEQSLGGAYSAQHKLSRIVYKDQFEDSNISDIADQLKELSTHIQGLVSTSRMQADSLENAPFYDGSRQPAKVADTLRTIATAMEKFLSELPTVRSYSDCEEIARFADFLLPKFLDQIGNAHDQLENLHWFVHEALHLETQSAMRAMLEIPKEYELEFGPYAINGFEPEDQSIRAISGLIYRQGVAHGLSAWFTLNLLRGKFYLDGRELTSPQEIPEALADLEAELRAEIDLDSISTLVRSGQLTEVFTGKIGENVLCILRDPLNELVPNIFDSYRVYFGPADGMSRLSFEGISDHRSKYMEDGPYQEDGYHNWWFDFDTASARRQYVTYNMAWDCTLAGYPPTFLLRVADLKSSPAKEIEINISLSESPFGGYIVDPSAKHTFGNDEIVPTSLAKLK